MDEEESMELALNSNFDSDLLDCWEAATADLDGGDGRRKDGEAGDNAAAAAALADREKYSSLGRFDRLPSFMMDQEGDGGSVSSSSSGQGRSALGQTVARGDCPVDAHRAVAAVAVSTGAPAHAHTAFSQRLAPSDANSVHGMLAAAMAASALNTKLHPLAIQASAKCPPHETMTSAAQPGGTAHNATGNVAMSSQNQALLPLAMNALAAGATLPYPFMMQAPGPSAAATPNNDMRSMLTSTSGPFASAPMPTTTNTITAPQSVPPFLLFDAPVELRTNFQQSQRAHGLPLLSDNNAFHFGISVNGFHPQRLPQGQQQNVRLIDARHGDIGEKRIKNAKEQKRAQKIAELIDELRSEMEKGGWKVGHKSKFNTLSS